MLGWLVFINDHTITYRTFNYKLTHTCKEQQRPVCLQPVSFSSFSFPLPFSSSLAVSNETAEECHMSLSTWDLIPFILTFQQSILKGERGCFSLFFQRCTRKLVFKALWPCGVCGWSLGQIDTTYLLLWCPEDMISFMLYSYPQNLCDLNLIRGKSGNLSWITFFLISGLHSSLL